MRADACHSAVVEHYYLIRVAYGRYALRNYEHRHALGLLRDGFSQRRVGSEVESGGAVVENEYLWIAYQRAGYRKALFLTARKVSATLFKFIIEPLRLLRNEVESLRYIEGFHYLFIGSVFIAPLHILADSAFEKHSLLRNYAHHSAQLLERIILYVHAAREHLAARNVVKAGDKVHKRRFSAARTADNADSFAARRSEVYIVERVALRAYIAELHVSEFYCGSFCIFGDVLAALVGERRGLIEYLKYSQRGSLRLGKSLYQLGKADKRKQYLRHVVYKRDDLALSDAAVVYADTAAPYDKHSGDIDYNVCQRAHHSGNFSRAYLHYLKRFGFHSEVLLLVVLTRESADNSNARDVFAREKGRLIQLFLYLLVHRHSAVHNVPNHRAEQGYGS